METTYRLIQREVYDGDEYSPEFPDFPPEIITEILLCLPARLIGRCRCVSKLFHSLSSDLGFVKRHTGRNGGNRKLLLSSRHLYSKDFDSMSDGTRDLVAVELSSSIKDEPGGLLAFELNYPFKDKPCSASKCLESQVNQLNLTFELIRRNRVEIIGSFNGLVCIYLEKGGGAFLYNPTTAESKKVPESLRSKLEPYGFGFDTLTDDYKLVKFVPTGDNEGYHNADVYSLKRDSWRRIQGSCYKLVVFTYGVQSNGAIHWVAKLENDQNKKPMVVASFDLTTESFRDIQLPDDAGDYRYLQAANLKGRLCLVFCDLHKHDCMWVMNEYGIEKSWSKIQLGMSYGSMTPLRSSTQNEEEVLLALDGELGLYNFESKTMRNLKINCDIHCTLGAITYVESLVSPNSYGNVGMEICSWK